MIDKENELNLAYLDSVCRWAEFLIDHATAIDFGEDDQDRVKALGEGAEKALAEMARIGSEAEKAGITLPLLDLASRYSLDEDEAAILKLSLVPSLDAGIRKRIARFKDNVLLDYVDVDFLSNVLYGTRLERLRARDRFRPGSRLVDGRLVTLSTPRDATTDTLPAQEVQVPDGVQSYIMGYAHPDRSISAFVDLSFPSEPLDGIVVDQVKGDEALGLLEGSTATGRRGFVVGLYGPAGTGKSLFAACAATRLGKPLLTVDCEEMEESRAAVEEPLARVFAEAVLRDSVVAFDRCEALFGQGGRTLANAAYGLMENHPGPVLLMTSQPRKLDPSLERHVTYQMDFEVPDSEGRERIWGLQLQRIGAAGLDDRLPELSMTFELTGGQIRNAVDVAKEMALARGDEAPTGDDLTAGAWSQVRADMEEYSTKRHVRLTMEDLILPETEKKAVEEVLDAARQRTYIMTKWGFGKRLATGKGLCCLFLGEPGTGKTLCAEILGEALGLNLYQISIPRIMSKYIGETEKNIERVFQTARANNSILLFDEADALFTKRVKVETSVDRFSNMEVNLLMQEIERYDGIVILTTNLEKNMDKAFERRIQFKIRFPFPDREHRTRIWKALVPRECPLEKDIDWDLVGESFDLSGGNIKNAILRAAYKAARDRKIIGTEHVVAAAEAECRASGRLFRGLKNEED